MSRRTSSSIGNVRRRGKGALPRKASNIAPRPPYDFLSPPNFMNSRIIFCVVAFAAALRADEVAPADLRGSGAAVEIVKHSLPFVKERGVAWIESRECTSCHQ